MKFLNFFYFCGQCCGSGMFIPDPGSWFLPIPDPGSKNSNQRERWKKISIHTFLCSHKFHKIVTYFSFEVLKKKIWANFQRIIELFTKNIVKKLWKIWSWDPGSEIRDPGSGKNLFRIPNPGSRGQKGTGSLIRIRNTVCGSFLPSRIRIHWPDWIRIQYGSGSETLVDFSMVKIQLFTTMRIRIRK